MLLVDLLAGADLVLLAVARPGADLSLLELEFWEFVRAFPAPLADEEVSDLLFDLRDRLSAGILSSL